MAQVDYYVDTGSTSGGTGTTSATSGANRAFVTLNAALSAAFTAYPNLVTSTVNIVIHCAATGGAADTTLPAWGSYWSGSSVVSATYNVTIQVDSANRHAGIYDTTKYRLENNNIPGINPLWAYVKFVGIQYQNGADDNGLSLFQWAGIAELGWRIEYCIAQFKQFTRTYGGASAGIFGGTDQTGATGVAVNSLFFNLHTGTNKGIIGAYSTNGNMVLYNCTFIGPTSAIDSTSSCVSDGYGRVNVTNCLFDQFASFGSHGTCDYDAADIASVPGTHSRSSQTFSFVDTSTFKYQITSSDAGAKGYGVDLSADATFAFSDDIAGSTRTVPWDIGAYMAAAASGVTATGSAGEGEGVAGAATSSESATATAGEGQGVTGTASASESATGAAGEGEGLAGSATVSESATGSAGEGQGVSGSATLSEAATGSAGEGQGVAGSATESIAASGSAGEGEGVAGTTTASESATGTAGEGEGVVGFTGIPPVTATGAAGEGEGVAGAATLSEAATGAAGEGEGVSGTATLSESATGAAGEAEGAAGTATENLAATATAGEGESIAGTATVTTPGAVYQHSATSTARPLHQATTVARPLHSATTLAD